MIGPCILCAFSQILYYTSPYGICFKTVDTDLYYNCFNTCVDFGHNIHVRLLIFLEKPGYKNVWPWHITSVYSPASHCGDPGLLRRLSSRICGRQCCTGTDFFPSPSVFPLSVSSHRCSIFTHVSSGGWTMGPLTAAVPQRHSLTHRNNKKYEKDKVKKVKVSRYTPWRHMGGEEV
jgi:hypothetical protein